MSITLATIAANHSVAAEEVIRLRDEVADKASNGGSAETLGSLVDRLVAAEVTSSCWEQVVQIAGHEDESGNPRYDAEEAVRLVAVQRTRQMLSIRKRVAFDATREWVDRLGLRYNIDPFNAPTAGAES